MSERDGGTFVMCQRTEARMGERLGASDDASSGLQSPRSETKRVLVGANLLWGEGALSGSSEVAFSEFPSWSEGYEGFRGADGGGESVQERTHENRVKTSDNQT